MMFRSEMNDLGFKSHVEIKVLRLTRLQDHPDCSQNSFSFQKLPGNVSAPSGQINNHSLETRPGNRKTVGLFSGRRELLQEARVHQT